MDALVTSLQRSGINRRERQTSGYSVYPVHDDSSLGLGQKIRYYQVTNSLAVTVREMNGTGEFIDIAIAGEETRRLSLYLYLERRAHAACP
jgi:uncharacterized protein